MSALETPSVEFIEEHGDEVVYQCRRKTSLENQSMPTDPLMASFATNVCNALSASAEIRFELHRGGLSIFREQSDGFSVDLSTVNGRFYLNFGGLEETVENVRTAFGLFLIALSPLSRLSARVQDNKTIIWRLAEFRDGRERRTLSESGYPLRSRTPVKQGTWVNELLSANECCRLMRMFRCEILLTE